MENNTRHLCRVPGADINAHLGNIYILTDNNDIENELQRLFESTGGMFYIPYAPVCIDDISKVTDGALADKAKALDANLFAQVFMPDQDAPMFLFETGDKAKLGIDAINMLHAAEDCSKESVRAAIRNYAINDPVGCHEWLTSPEDENASGISFDVVVPEGTSFKGVCNYSADVSPNEAKMMTDFNAARDNFVKNVLEIQSGKSENSAKAEKEIARVINQISESQKTRLLTDFFTGMDADELEEFVDKFIDHTKIVRNSKIKLMVEKADDCMNNDGFYRLYYKYADSEKQPLHFKHKSACIVYLMLMIYRKKDKEMNTFFAFDKESAADKDLFIRLMTTVYDKNPAAAESDYDNLFTDKYGVQGRLKDYIKACKDLFDNEVSNFESPYPFTPKKLNSNGKEFVLPILPDNITFPEYFQKTFVEK